ncbi:hypothetical protein [Streptomyces pseudovenezuelae]|uniref:hypothetical protein n=1 Tax=Streptomyces pseudovenezuelae TaxID=67350 RepID=UPI00371A3F3F
MDAVSGVVGVAYSHFYINEYVEPDFDSATQAPDVRTEAPVIVTPGQLAIVSHVQSHGYIRPHHRPRDACHGLAPRWAGR